MEKKDNNQRRPFFLNNSIRTTIFIYFTVTALAAGLLITFSLYQRLSGQVTAMVQDENQRLIGQVARSVESYLRTIMKLSDSLYYGAVKNADLSSESVGSELTLLYDNNKDNVDNIALFSEDGMLVEAVPAARLKPNLDVTGEPWFRDALEKTENQHFSLPHVQYIFDNNENQYRWVISLSRAVELTSGTSTAQGILLVDISYSSLEQLFDGVTAGKGGYVYLISSDGELLYHPKMQLIDSGRMQENNVAAAAYKDGNHMEEFDGSSRFVTIKSIGYTGWKVVGVTPENVVTLNTIKTRLFIVFIIALILFILALINSYISSRITNPIKELEKSVGILEEGNLDVPVYAGGSYEIQHLGKSIGDMAAQIRLLMKDIVTEHEAKRKQEFDTLQSQINPHFLYNTLQCMGGIALMNDQPLVAEMASNMAEIFRYSIKEGDKVTVREETDFLKKYLDICDVRFNGRFRWEMEMEEGIGELPIDKMILQPLVENAVYHGLEKRTELGGMLWIKGRREGQSLVFSIIDNGGRLEGERLAKLQETLADRELLEQERRARKRIGLVNIQSRLKLMYGEEGGLTVEGKDGKVIVTVRLPIEETGIL